MWCPLPWIHQFVTNDGIKTCCIGREKGPVSPVAFKNSQIVQDVKLSILAGKIHPNCTGCAVQEAQGYTSTRLEAIRDYPSYTPATVPDCIEYLDLRYNNLCNFSCRTCEPAFSSSIVKETKQHPVLKQYYKSGSVLNLYDTVVDDVFMLLPDIKKINFTGGEPLIIKDNIKILEKLVELKKFDCEILITTNCSVYNPQWHQLLSQFKYVHWTFSIDGIRESAEYIRYGTKWSEVDNNIKNIVQSTHSVAFNTTVSAYSILNIDKLVKYFLEIESLSNGPTELWFHICNSPAYLHPNVLTGAAAEQAKCSIDSAIDLLENTKHLHIIDFLKNVYNSLNTNTTLNEKFLEFTKNLDDIRNQNFQILLKA